MIEISILSGLINRPDFSTKVMPFIKPDYFPDERQRVLFGLVTNFVTKYGSLPTRESLYVDLSERKMPEGLHDGVKSLIAATTQQTETLTELSWLMDSTEKWCQDRAIYNAIMSSVDILEGVDKKRDKHILPKLLQEALAVCFQTSIGHDYFADAEAQWQWYHDPVNKIPFSVDILNKITKNGVTRKTLSLILAGINVGKSTTLISLASDYLDQGLNVLYVTLEVAENVIRERTDVSAMGIGFDELRALEKQQYINRVNNIRNKTQGELIIKEFAPSSVHVGHLRHVVNEIKTKKGWTPDVIMVDYLTLMLSSLIPAAGKGDSNTYYTSVAEELRGLMKEFNCIGWSAAQFNRGGQDADDVTMSDTGLAIGIQATADLSIALMAPEELAKMRQALMKVLKNRFANKQIITRAMVSLDNDLQRLGDVSESEQSSVMDSDEKEAYSQMAKAESSAKAVTPKSTIDMSVFAGFNFGD